MAITAYLLALSAMFSLLMISPCLCATNVLYSALGGGVLPTNGRLAYGEYTLIMQEDCNLVLYKKGGVPIWASGTWNKGTDCQLTLDSYGNLVIYGYVGSGHALSPLWSSGVKSTLGSYALVVKYDGSLLVYGPSLWYSNPTPPKSTYGSLIHKSNLTRTYDSVLWSGDIAPIGTTLECNEYKLELPQDCNLTLSNTNTGTVLWYSNKTNFNKDCFVNLEPNGEFKVKYYGGDLLWTNGVSGAYSEFVLALRPDGRLVVYGPSIWSWVKTTGDAVAVPGIAMVSEV